MRPKSSTVASHSGPAGRCKSLGSPRIARASSPAFHRQRSRVCKAKWSLWSPLSAISNLSTQTNRAALVRMEREGAFPTRRFYVFGGGRAAENYTVNRQWQLAHIMHTYLRTFVFVLWETLALFFQRWCLNYCYKRAPPHSAWSNWKETAKLLLNSGFVDNLDTLKTKLLLQMQKAHCVHHTPCNFREGVTVHDQKCD